MVTKSTKEASETSAETVIKKTVTAKAASKTAKPVDDITPLTEEQLLKMPESDYMNAAQIAFFRARLRTLEQDLLSNAGATTENLRETQFVPDPADRATIEEEHAIELRTRDRERKLLKKVQQCISLLDSGEYGWCEETGEPISLRRLLARPTATLSLEAQERREMRQKMFGD
jgi:DnaK suppressor protein